MQRGSLDVPSPQSWLLFNTLSLFTPLPCCSSLQTIVCKTETGLFQHPHPTKMEGFFFLNLSYSLLLTPVIYFSQTFTNLFSSSPLIYPGTHSVLQTHRHTHTLISIQTRSCLCVQTRALCYLEHSLDYHCTHFCSSPHVLGHTCASL